MNLPVVGIALGFSAGIVLHQYFKVSAQFAVIGLVFSLPFLWVSRGHRYFLPMAITAFALLGMLYSKASLQKSLYPVEQWNEQGYVSLEGIVKTPPEVKTHGKKVNVSFTLESRNLMKWDDGRPALHLTQGDVKVFLFQPPVIPSIDDTVRIRGRLETPKTALNPGQFDYRRYLEQQNIYSVYYGIGKNALRIQSISGKKSWRRGLASCRLYLEKRMDLFFKKEDAVLIKALILGIRRDISWEIREDFMKTGTAHTAATVNRKIFRNSFQSNFASTAITQVS